MISQTSKKRCCAARDVNADFFDCNGFLPTCYAFRGLHFAYFGRQLAAVEFLYVLTCDVDCFL